MLQVKDIDIRLINLRTRLPFRYGITTLRACPHLFLKLTLEINGQIASGISADHLPPKWFTKNPESPFENDVKDMIDVIRHAADHAVLAGQRPDIYSLASALYLQQSIWAKEKNYPPLLAGFGTSLVERAAIEAFCRAKRVPFARALRENLLGIRFSGFADERLMLDYQELGDTTPGDWLPKEPLRQCLARHTIGMLDYLTDDEIPAGERANDGLPESFEAAIRYYNLTHFKVKIACDIDKDLPRLTKIFRIIEQHAPPNWAYTMDGNEIYKQMSDFRAYWETLTAQPALQAPLSRLIFIEQPIHRDVALSDTVKSQMHDWPNRPPIVIDESDGFPGAAQRALDCGYAGTSHKNCKGIIKGIANACLIAKKRQDHPGQKFLLSGEDLCNIGPIALNQDLAVCAALGIENVERNGHHYFKGLSMHSDDVQSAALAAHPDLYRRHENNFTTMNVQQGRLDITSIVNAPFGVDFELDVTKFARLRDWTFEAA